MDVSNFNFATSLVKVNAPDMQAALNEENNTFCIIRHDAKGRINGCVVISNVQVKDPCDLKKFFSILIWAQYSAYKMKWKSVSDLDLKEVKRFVGEMEDVASYDFKGLGRLLHTTECYHRDAEGKVWNFSFSENMEDTPLKVTEAIAEELANMNIIARRNKIKDMASIASYILKTKL